MSCRALSQPLFVEGLVSGYGNGGGFLDRIEKAFDWPPLKALPAPIRALRRAGRPIRPSPQLSLRPAKNPPKTSIVRSSQQQLFAIIRRPWYCAQRPSDLGSTSGRARSAGALSYITSI